MKNSKKRTLINVVAAMLTVCLMLTAFTTTAFAATQLSSVSITFEKTTTGGKAPKVTATKSGTEVREVVWEKKDFSAYKPGDVAKGTVKLTTKKGYYFKDDYSKSDIKLTNAAIDTFSYKEGDLWVRVRYYVGGKLATPKDLEWEIKYPGRARWDSVKHADSYTILLVRGNKTKKITDVKKNYYDFDEHLLTDTYFDRDDVYIKVMAVPKSSATHLKNSDYGKSGYFEYWDELYEEHYDSDWEDPKPSTPPNHNNSGCGWYQDPKNSKWYYIDSKSGEKLKGWLKIGNAWYFMKLESGEMISEDWYYDNGTWYYFDLSGAMATGWRYIDGYWYYLSASGAMVKGEQKIDGITYYFAGNGTLQR